MKAIRYQRYGSAEVLEYQDAERPAAGDDDVLIAVRAASVNPFDVHGMRGEPYLFRLALGLRTPKEKRLGVDVAGRVEAVGRNVTQLVAGDEVFGVCRGAFAEFACSLERALVKKPQNVTFEQAAAVPVAGLTALQALRNKGRIQPGQKVLINGASGGVGTFAVQIAKAFGAEVTGVCSTRNVELVRRIGAAHAIDYTQEDFTKGATRYDMILDCISNHSLSACVRVLTAKGAYVVVGGKVGRWIAPLPRVLAMLALSPFMSQRLVMSPTKRSQEDLELIRGFMEAGQVVPVIDRSYKLTEAAEAVRYVDAGHTRGKVVITV